MKLGVFDSGIGGEAVAASLKTAFPQATILIVNDREHLPYGDREQTEIISLTDPAIQPLLAQKCDVIILACNSATPAAIETLRERYPQQKFIGLEPMVKPAVTATKTGIVTICATPATLSSERYHRLKDRYGTDVTIIEPDCSLWASLIEQNEITDTRISQTILPSLEKGSDTIVLACTHYHWIKERISAIAPDATILDPSDAIVRRVKELLP